jgi:hypothetical protein
MEIIIWNGKQISKPGIYSGIDIDLYHDPEICIGTSISSSGLRTIIGESPADFFAYWKGNPKHYTHTEARHYAFGRAVHHLHLATHWSRSFADTFAAQPLTYKAEDGTEKAWSNNAKVCKEWNRAQAEAGRTILKSDELVQIADMERVMAQVPLAGDGLLNGLVEHSIFWKDRATGIWLKSRPDAIPLDSGLFVDLKTTTSTQHLDCRAAVRNFGYHQQGALVLEGAREVLHMEYPTFHLLFQKKTPPYSARLWVIDPIDLSAGHKLNHIALQIFVRCLKSGHWPGPGGEREDVEMLSLSPRDREYDEERIVRLSQD